MADPVIESNELTLLTERIIGAAIEVHRHDRRVVVELKAVEQLLPVHTSQVLTYLRLLDLRLGLVVNFNVPTLVKGIRRVANQFSGSRTRLDSCRD